MEIKELLGDIVAFVGERLVPPIPEVQHWQRPDEGEVYVAVRDDHKLVEVKGVERAWARHIFSDAKSFAEWLNRHVDEREACEITLNNQGLAIAALNAGEALASEVRMVSALDPYLAAFLSALGTPMSQRDFQQLVRGYGDVITAPSKPDLLGMLGTLKVAAKDGFESTMDETGATRFVGNASNRSIEGQVPPTITLRVPYFQDVHPIVENDLDLDVECHYEVELCVSFSHEDLAFTLTAPGLPKVLRTAVNDLRLYLNALLDAGFLVGNGTLERLVLRGAESPTKDEDERY